MFVFLLQLSSGIHGFCGFCSLKSTNIIRVTVNRRKTKKQKREREREMFYLTTHSTHFIYGYKASDIWLSIILIVRKETRCRHIGYSYRLTAKVLLYAPSHTQDNTYHGLCYTSRGALAGTKTKTFFGHSPIHPFSLLPLYISEKVSNLIFSDKKQFVRSNQCLLTTSKVVSLLLCDTQ